ncbi:root meristem growth factor [Perilla frutescens var. frutescens]|nr:root meristem growth factor [Perilla frutescens var. frutescens]
MEPSTLVAAFCVAVSFMMASCASDQVNVQESEQQYVQQPYQLTLPLLPRKLKLQEEVKSSSADKDIMLQKLLEASAGPKKVEKDDVVINHAAKRGTWREWVERPNKSEYFTMDYAWVRRRRPIHNK